MSGGLQIRAAHFPGRAAIDAYGNGGFRFAEMSHRGSILCLPSGIHGWAADDPTTLDEEDFARPLAEAGAIEILLVGTGRQLLPLPPELRARLREAGMAVETMATGAAVRTFNVLLAEERAVAAALIAVD
ncbi:Mth938-like domain-containing protein [Chelativorans intermedius]|uniref:Mth938-like domain-containing protein n=1 Tax=Chelativorans intermedius TaxID=515947 RepID=A0ABV6D527_9HYPH|nr:Mth938-like domain-containing protein [Chelativorans intermedius]MCT8997217.1 Mth938-like domain-containing protein [Chelativorans intermedius]